MASSLVGSLYFAASSLMQAATECEEKEVVT